MVRRPKNTLIHGDNIHALRRLVKKYRGMINLIYIDPPFATNNVFRISRTRTSAVSMQRDSKIAYTDIITGSEYVLAIQKRLKLAYKLLSKNGSLYLHIDNHMAYSIKPVLDEIFGRDCFRNSIARIKSNPKNFRQKGYGNIHDTILFYTKSKHVWNDPYTTPGNGYQKRFDKNDNRGMYMTAPLYGPGETVKGKTGKEWMGVLPPAGRHWKYPPERLGELDRQNYIDWSKSGNPRLKVYKNDMEYRGVLLQDVWRCKDPTRPVYPTEKHLGMLETIIKASTNPHDTVLDFYCGSGTTLLAAAKNNRIFIGVDRSDEAIKCCVKKLNEYEYGFKVIKS